jgi:hypothetical protein
VKAYGGDLATKVRGLSQFWRVEYLAAEKSATNNIDAPHNAPMPTFYRWIPASKL